MVLFIKYILIFTSLLNQKYDLKMNADFYYLKDSVVMINQDPIYLDLNDDQINDFIIEYLPIATTDVPTSIMGIIGKIIPKNDNRILHKVGKGCIFLETGDTIFSNNQLKLNWSKYPSDLISIYWTIDQGLDSAWKVNAKPPYYIAFRLKIEQIDYLGWMEISVNKYNGIISIIDYKFEKRDYLIIDK